MEKVCRIYYTYVVNLDPGASAYNIWSAVSECHIPWIKF